MEARPAATGDRCHGAAPPQGGPTIDSTATADREQIVAGRSSRRGDRRPDEGALRPEVRQAPRVLQEKIKGKGKAPGRYKKQTGGRAKSATPHRSSRCRRVRVRVPERAHGRRDPTDFIPRREGDRRAMARGIAGSVKDVRVALDGSYHGRISRGRSRWRVEAFPRRA